MSQYTEIDDEVGSFKSVISNQSQNVSQALFDVKQCEELFQKDKSLKMQLDIEEIRNKMVQAKNDELEFYRKLNLPNDIKKNVFGIDAPQVIPQPKIIVWDPVKGNLIMTEQEFKQIYKE